jgi:DNA transformation protein
MSREFVAHVTELLGGLGRLQARPMFGGHGLYSGGKFFAFVLDDVLYFKVDAQSRPLFERAGSTPFVYLKRTTRPSVNYYRAPAEALESPDAALRWAREALRAAIAARPSPPARRARSRATSRTRGRRRTGKA